MELELLSGQKQKNEHDYHVVACNDYLRLGIGRSLSRLAQRYTDLSPKEAPTKHLSVLKTWSSKFGWQSRATEYDAEWEHRKTIERNAELDQGLALDYDRVRRLKRLADLLEDQIYEVGADGRYHNIWLPDVKQIGTGDNAERVDIERFNAQLFEQYRKAMEDIAKEVGGRIQKSEVKIEDWRTDAIRAIQEGKLGYDDLLELFDEDMAARLLTEAKLAGI